MQFRFVERNPAAGSSSLAPMIPIALKGSRLLAVSALLDTGAAVNVLPHGIGLQLGFIWEQQTTSVQLTGNLASVESRVVIVAATVAQFPPVRLAFAWAKQDEIPVILGQTNFFMEFDVCFYRSRRLFDVRPRLQSFFAVASPTFTTTVFNA
jgi:hypothetical protein